MNKVKRAIIMAAGLGKRMYPLTLDTPKPLISVNGTRMIESIINALHINGINEIHVVVGYKKELFNYLKSIEGISLIDNPFFDSANNISSLYVARDFLEDAIILDGDQIINSPTILCPSFEKSGYNAVWTDSETSEWIMEVENNTVISCSRTGGTKGWQLYSISRWTKEDGQKLRYYLEQEFIGNNNKDVYWDDIPMFLHASDFNLGITPMNKGDIIEIDNIHELASNDNSYSIYLKDAHE